MASKDREIQNFPHHNRGLKYKLRKVKTVDDLFTQDDVNTVIEEVNKDKSKYTEIIVIGLDEKNELSYYYNGKRRDLVYMLDRVKFLLHSEWEE